MRVVGGRLKGRNLASPATRDIRPTADRLRESLFNILVHAYDDPIEDARVLDLFAGTGALGIEAISRGAAFALFVDNGAEARALLRNNVEALGLGGVTKVYRRDATNLGPAHPVEPFSLVFLDPPYRMKLAEKALASLRDGGWLTPGALLVVEEAKAAFAAPDGFEELERRAYDDTEFVFLKIWLRRSPNHCHHAPRKRGIQYSRDVDDSSRTARRTGSPGQEPGDDSRGRGRALLHRLPNSFSISESFNST
jgi:16S rRNA (guanine966-N2)-methyltransferase